MTIICILKELNYLLEHKDSEECMLNLLN